jgi:hypothetical protein
MPFTIQQLHQLELKLSFDIFNLSCWLLSVPFGCRLTFDYFFSDHVGQYGGTT